MTEYLGAKMSQSKNNQPLPSNAKDRKERPMYRGLLAYFPDALAEIANVSHVGNEQHNPGEAMHWARDKSKDHADCVVRHLVEQGSMDDDGLRHSAKMAWRALALLQTEIESHRNGVSVRKQLATYNSVSKDGLTRPQDPRDGFDPLGADRWNFDIPEGSTESRHLYLTGDAIAVVCETCSCQVCVAYKASEQPVTNSRSPMVYIAGPMRGIAEFNFPAFDAARDLAKSKGWDPISPADVDREAGINEETNPTEVSGAAASRVFAERDCAIIIGLKVEQGDAIAMLPGWTNSTGARAEFFLADWVGLRVLNALTMEPFTVQEQKELWNEFNHKGLAELRASALRIIGKGE